MGKLPNFKDAHNSPLLKQVQNPCNLHILYATVNQHLLGGLYGYQNKLTKFH